MGALRHTGPHTLTHTQDHTRTHSPPVPFSMPMQPAKAPDAAVVFSADNLLPRTPALSVCINFAIYEPSWSESLFPHADYGIKVHGGRILHKGIGLHLEKALI